MSYCQLLPISYVHIFSLLKLRKLRRTYSALIVPIQSCVVHNEAKTVPFFCGFSAKQEHSPDDEVFSVERSNVTIPFLKTREGNLDPSFFAHKVNLCRAPWIDLEADT